MTADANCRTDDHLVGVARVGDLLQRGAVEVGEYAVARMGPAEFERLIALLRHGDSAEPPSPLPSPGQGRRMSDQARHQDPSPSGSTG